MPRKPYKLSKVVLPGWEACNQRGYLVVDRETDLPLGFVHDQRLWNLYDDFGEDWQATHSDDEICSDPKRKLVGYYSSRRDAARSLFSKKVLYTDPHVLKHSKYAHLIES